MKPIDLIVSDEQYNTTLDWCNKQRQVRGLEPLKRLPPGVPYNPRSCPCGKACGGYVSVGILAAHVFKGDAGDLAAWQPDEDGAFPESITSTVLIPQPMTDLVTAVDAAAEELTYRDPDPDGDGYRPVRPIRASDAAKRRGKKS